MWKTNLKVIAVCAIVIAFYTGIAQIIPQLESEVPETLDLSAGFTTEGLVAAGEGLFQGAGGCTACHGLGTRAPNLLTDHNGEGTVGERCGGRQPGLDCKAYLYESLTQPNTFLVDGFPGIMTDVSRQLSGDQIWAIVAFLQSQGGEVTVTAADIPAAGDTPQGTPSGSAAPAFAATTDPRELLMVNACIGCHGIDGTQVPIGPSFDGIGARLSANQIRVGILDPNAETAAGFETFAGTMPLDFGTRLSATQLEAIVQFLADRR